MLGQDLNASTPQFLEAATTSDSGRSADQVWRCGGAPVHHIPSMDYFTAKSLFQTWILQTRRVKFNIILAIGFAVDIYIYIYKYVCMYMNVIFFLNYLYKCDPTWPNSVTCPRCSWFQLSVARRFGNFSRESERVKHSPRARQGSLAEFVLFVDRFSWQTPHNPIQPLGWTMTDLRPTYMHKAFISSHFEYPHSSPKLWAGLLQGLSENSTGLPGNWSHFRPLGMFPSTSTWNWT